MKQIIVNYLLIIGLPIIVGIGICILEMYFQKEYIFRILLSIITVISWIIAKTIPTHGSELLEILALMITNVLIAYVVTGFLVKWKSKQ